VPSEKPKKEARWNYMVHAGLDLSRKRLDVQLLAEDGSRLEHVGVPPDADGLRSLVCLVAERFGGQQVHAVVESMNGARFVHDQLEVLGWAVEMADAQKVKGLAPLACKTDKIDAWVLAKLSHLALVPAIWLPPQPIRAARERARWRLHLVRHRTMFKNRVHQTLMAFGQPCPMSDLFGTGGHQLLERLQLPEPWATTVATSVACVDQIGRQIEECERELRTMGAEHPYIRLLTTVPGIGWILGYTVAAEIGDINRFSSPGKLISYTGLCPSVRQSGTRDDRGPLTKHGPKYLRWALIEAAHVAARQPLYAARYQATKRRLGKQRGSKVAAIQLARQLTEAIWYILIRQQPFAPAGAIDVLAA
jgi:transposase